jgi:phosphoribosylformylglycinamidine synthase PurS subunit
MDYEVLVQLKAEVLDPEGRAIHETLRAQGIKDIAGVSVAKRYVVRLDASAANPLAIIEDVARRYLANPVSETFSIKRLDA